MVFKLTIFGGSLEGRAVSGKYGVVVGYVHRDTLSHQKQFVMKIIIECGFVYVHIPYSSPGI